MQDTMSAFYFPTAVALGALHALEPGHAKALTAAYLIGIKGTKRDSLLLGLSVAATHSIIVISISLLALWIGREAFAGEATHSLELASGVIAILIGIWMLQRRLRIILRRKRTLVVPGGTPIDDPAMTMHSRENHAACHGHGNRHNHGHDHGHHRQDGHGHHGHDHLDDDAHARAHAEAMPEYAKRGDRPTPWQIMLFGAAGGLIPCPASITVMLLALSAGRTGFGLFTVFGFSLGLAAALVGVGMLVVTGLSKLSDTGKLSWVSRQAPLVSACLVILSGVFALAIALKG